MANSVEYLRWARRNKPRLIALNMAYGILMNHGHCLKDDVTLDGMVESIADAIQKGAIPAGEPEPQ